MGNLLGKLLKKKYPKLHPDNQDQIVISFDDLLDWELWPNFIKLYGKIEIAYISYYHTGLVCLIYMS